MGTDSERFGRWVCACIKRSRGGQGVGMLIDEIDGSIPVFRALKQGELVHVQGVPLRLVTDVLVQSTEGNWNLIKEFKAEEAEADKGPRGADQSQVTPRRFHLGDRVFSGRHEGRVTAIAEGGWVRVKRRVLTIWYREADLHRLLAESRGEGLYFYPERTNAND